MGRYQRRDYGAQPADLHFGSWSPSTGTTKARDLTRPGTPWSPYLSTFGPHAIGTERFLAVSSGASFAQDADGTLRKEAVMQNPDKTPMAWGRHEG